MITAALITQLCLSGFPPPPNINPTTSSMARRHIRAHAYTHTQTYGRAKNDVAGVVREREKDKIKLHHHSR